jgi:hypothetical protein
MVCRKGIEKERNLVVLVLSATTEELPGEITDAVLY